jgi:hypothetical protein
MSEIFCNFAAELIERTKSMETAMRTVQITLPLADASFLRRLSGNMGWQITAHRAVTHRRSCSKSYYQSEQFYHDLETAEQDIANGKGLRVSSKQELDALFA